MSETATIDDVLQDVFSESLYDNALEAAQGAAEKADAAIGVQESERGADCGRAIVVIDHIDSPFAKWLWANQIGYGSADDDDDERITGERREDDRQWYVHSWDLHNVKT